MTDVKPPIKDKNPIVLSKEIAHEFEKEEIMEIHRYLETNVPHSVLSQTFILTEQGIAKSKVFTIAYRLLDTSKNYVRRESTRQKLIKLLDETKDLYPIVYELLSKYQGHSLAFNKHRIEKKISNIYLNKGNNEKVNKLIDVFLVLIEKQELMDIDKIVGLDLDNEIGQKVYTDLALDKDV